MMPAVKRDMMSSSTALQSIVWPQIRHWCGGGELLMVEDQQHSAPLNRLDMIAGIDAFQVSNDECLIRGIASRIQFGGSWPSFTIRSYRSTGAKTELKKRLKAYHSPQAGWILPALTIQAYVSGEQLVYAAMVRTRDLYRYVNERPKELGGNVNPEDGNGFLVAWVSKMRDAGVRVRTTDE